MVRKATHCFALLAAVMLAMPSSALPCVARECCHAAGENSAEEAESCCGAHGSQDHGSNTDSALPDHAPVPAPCDCPPDCPAPCGAGKLPCTTSTQLVIVTAPSPVGSVTGAAQTLHPTLPAQGIFRPPRG